MARRTLATLAAIVILGVTHSLTLATAGIQNVQSALATEAEEGFSGKTTLGADWRTGNVSFLFLSASLAARVKQDKHLLVALAKLERKTNNDSVLVSRTFEHLRYRYQLDERWLLESFAQHEFNGIKRLTVRTVFGAGPNLELVQTDRLRLAMGVAYMLEYERVRTDDELDTGDAGWAHRASSYAVASFELDERVQLVETFYIQPRLTDGRDLRLLSDASIIVKLTKSLSMATTLNIAYDSRPVETIERLDTALNSSLIYEW